MLQKDEFFCVISSLESIQLYFIHNNNVLLCWNLNCFQTYPLPHETSILDPAQTKGCCSTVWRGAGAPAGEHFIYQHPPVKDPFFVCSSLEQVGKTNSSDLRRPDSLQTGTVQISTLPTKAPQLLPSTLPLFPGNCCQLAW